MARSLANANPNLAPVQASGATTGAFPFLRPNYDTLVCDFEQAGEDPTPLWKGLSPAPAGLFFGPRRSFIGFKKSPALLASGASRSIPLDVPPAKQIRGAGDGSR